MPYVHDLQDLDLPQHHHHQCIQARRGEGGHYHHHAPGAVFIIISISINTSISLSLVFSNCKIEHGCDIIIYLYMFCCSSMCDSRLRYDLVRQVRMYCDIR